jgi:hypothetical protein
MQTRMSRLDPGLVSLPAGRLLAVAGFAAVALLALARPVAAEEPERKNCPDGFIWIRSSGTACVQETVPANGRIGYDGHAICNDGYAGVYEFRGTTDGKGVDGNPASAYSYLLECVTPEEASRRKAAGTPGDLTKLLAGRQAERPSAEEVVVIGLTATGGILVVASRFRIRPKPGTGAATSPTPPALAQPTEEAETTPPPEPEPLPTDPAEIEQRLGQLREIDEKLRQVADKIREDANAADWTWEDVVTLVGGISDILGPFTGPGSPYVGAVSVAANLSQMTAEMAGWTDVRSTYREMRRHLEEIARMRGMIAGDVQALQDALVAAAKPPDSGPGRIDVDPAVLPDQVLREEKERAQQRVSDAFDVDRRASDEADALRDERRAQQEALDYWRRSLAEFDRQRRERQLPSDAGKANTDINLAAAFDGYVQQYGEEAAAKVVKAASEDLGAARLAGRDFVEVATTASVRDAAADLADGALRAGSVANVVGAGTGYMSLTELFTERTAEQQRAILEREAESIAYRLGELDRLVTRADQRAELTTQTFRDEVAHRDAVRAEASRRAEQQGHVLWTQ